MMASMRQVTSIAMEIAPTKCKAFTEFFEDVTPSQHSYVFANLCDFQKVVYKTDVFSASVKTWSPASAAIDTYYSKRDEKWYSRWFDVDHTPTVLTHPFCFNGGLSGCGKTELVDGLATEE